MSGAYTALVSRVLFPLHERWKGHATLRLRRALEESQWLPRDALVALQSTRLAALVEHASAHVPYYRAAFARHGIDAGTVRSAADLARLPFLTKADIRANQDALRSERAGPLARSNTGGSSGEPLTFYLGKERVSHDVAAKWRATRWWGVDIGDPEIVVWGSPIELGAQDRVRELRDRVFRTALLSAFEMSAARVDAFVARIRARRPRMLFGYPSALAHIARHAEAAGVRLDDLGIAVAFVTAERLYDDQRDTIARVFGCRVANGYGGRDAGFVAHECPAGGLHLTAEDLVVETVDAEGRVVPPGTAGELVVTHLASREFPFIRYRTGDVGTLDTRACTCGRGLPLLRSVEGRTTDFVVAADGTVMHGLALIYVVRAQTGVRAFKIVQETRAATRVLLVRDAGFDDGVAAAIVAGMKARLGAHVDVRLEYVDAIPPERSGKHRYVVSHVAQDAGAARREPLGVQ
jgi:phenylacetate-CoA ligase